MTLREHTVLERFRSLLQGCVPLVAVAAFGSRVRPALSGASDDDSDLDVLVVTDVLTPAVRLAVSDCAFEA